MALGLVYLAALLLFLLLLLSLGLQPKCMGRISGYLLVAVAAAGILFYGYGYYRLYDSVAQAAARTLFSVFCMFLGRNEISAISGVEPLKSAPMQILLYAVHLLALYCTASAVVSAIGARLVRTLHLWLSRRGERVVIFGVSDGTVSFGEKLQKDFSGVVLFVDEGGGASFDGRILRMGSLLLTDEVSRRGGPGFLKKIGFRGGSRGLRLYCLSEDPAANRRFALSLLEGLKALGADPDRTSLTILLEEEARGVALQNGERYGYGSVLAFDQPGLLARLMIRLAPPCDSVRFDGKGRATEDFQALVVGFGRGGQAALQKLMMNGQFEGSRFRAIVDSRDHEGQLGSFLLGCPAAAEAGDIRFLDADARSGEMLRCLREEGAGVRYLVIATGSDGLNGELAGTLGRMLRAQGRQAVLLQLNAAGVIRTDTRGTETAALGLYDPQVLCGQSLDRRAMALNHSYCKGESAEADWRRADYFSRQSSRASADYTAAFLRAAGLSPKEGRDPARWRDPELLENLSRMEHLRWCGFHYAMGYRPMPREVWEERARTYAEEKARTGASSLRIGKDSGRRLHACLIPWEALPELGAREAAVTGKPVDYQAMDRDNVLAIPRLLEL